MDLLFRLTEHSKMSTWFFSHLYCLFSFIFLSFYIANRHRVRKDKTLSEKKDRRLQKMSWTHFNEQMWWLCRIEACPYVNHDNEYKDIYMCSHHTLYTHFHAQSTWSLRKCFLNNQENKSIEVTGLDLLLILDVFQKLHFSALPDITFTC